MLTSEREGHLSRPFSEGTSPIMNSLPSWPIPQWRLSCCSLGTPERPAETVSWQQPATRTRTLDRSLQSHEQMQAPSAPSPTALVIFPQGLPLESPSEKTPWASPAPQRLVLAWEPQCTVPTGPTKGTCPRPVALALSALGLPVWPLETFQVLLPRCVLINFISVSLVVCC